MLRVLLVRLTPMIGKALNVSRHTVVVAAAGYPATPRTGDRIAIGAVPDDVVVFHAGTAERGGELVSAGSDSLLP